MDGQTSATQVTLGRLMNHISYWVRVCGWTIDMAVKTTVSQVPAETLGTLIVQADSFVSTCRVKSRVGIHSRYSESWEAFLRESLESILTVALSLDWADSPEKFPCSRPPTSAYSVQVSLAQLVVDTAALVHIEGYACREAIRITMRRIPSRALGRLLAEAGSFIDPADVEYYHAAPMPSASTKAASLRGQLNRILTAILAY